MPSTVVTCIGCNEPTVDGKCVNANCEHAHQSASRFAGRTTAKATAGAVSASPNAWASSGRVD